MVGALAELISYQIDDAVKKLQSVSRYKISPGNISSLYVLLGCLLLIVIPAMIFTKVEGNSATFLMQPPQDPINFYRLFRLELFGCNLLCSDIINYDRIVL